MNQKKSVYVAPYTRSDGTIVGGYYREGSSSSDSAPLGSQGAVPGVGPASPVSPSAPAPVQPAPVVPEEPSYELEPLPVDSDFVDDTKTFERYVGDGSIITPDEAKKKPKEFRSQFDEWKASESKDSFQSWMNDNPEDFESIGNTINSEYLEANDLPSLEAAAKYLDNRLIRKVGLTKKEMVGRINEIEEGKEVGVRIDINTFLKSGHFVITVHDNDGLVGTPLTYENMVRLDGGVVFEANEKAGYNIGKKGKNKATIAVVKGELSHDRDIPSDIDSWTPVGYNPHKAVFFYDKRSGKEVLAGDESISFGNTVFVKSPQYGERTASNAEDAYKVTKGQRRKTYVAKSMSMDELLDELYDLAYFDPDGYYELFEEKSPEQVVKIGYDRFFSSILDQ